MRMSDWSSDVCSSDLARALTGYRVVDAVFGALAQVVPHRIPAAGEGGNTGVCLSGRRADVQPFIIVDMIGGAWGGRSDKDGIEAITNQTGRALGRDRVGA